LILEPIYPAEYHCNLMPAKRIMAASVLCVLAVVVIAAILFAPREPSYGGRPLSYWAMRLGPNSDHATREAITSIGAGGVPYLISMLRRKDWPFRDRVVAWVSSHKRLASVLKFGPSAEISRRGALAALACLGPKARPALPDILPLLTNQSPPVRINAFYAFTAIAPDTPSVTSFIPALTNGLSNPDWTMRSAAERALDSLHPLPESLLLDLANGPDKYARDAAINCLAGRTNPTVISALEARTHVKDSLTVTLSIMGLGSYGKGASESVPRLHELCQDRSLNVREAATNALRLITGEDHPAPGPTNVANITFNFGGLPVEQAIDMCEGLAKKKIASPPTGWPTGTIRAINPYPMTTNEASELLEDVLKHQARVTIQRASNGTLSAVVNSP
jgi:hypothetical protein